MILTLGRTEIRVIDNRPVWALTWGLWRFEPDQDDRRWFWRARVGPLKLEAVRCRHGGTLMRSRKPHAIRDA